MTRMACARHNLAVALGSVAVGNLLCAGGMAMAAEPDQPQERTVSVSATGSVAAEPDLATISTGVVSEADTAREALVAQHRDDGQSDRRAEGARHLRPGHSHDGGQRRTALPQRQRSGTGHCWLSGRQSGAHYGARFEALGRGVGSDRGLGVNQIGGIAFEVSKAEELRDEARKAAMANALRRARLYASSAGAEIGAVVTISEDAPAAGAAAVGAHLVGSRRCADRTRHPAARGENPRHLGPALVDPAPVCGDKGHGDQRRRDRPAARQAREWPPPRHLRRTVL